MGIALKGGNSSFVLPKPPRFITPEEEAALKAEDERREAWERFRRSGVPERYRAASLADCPQAVQDWAASIQGADKGGWLVLAGSNGTGKTYAAAAVANANNARSVRFTTCQAILGEIYDSFSSPERAEAVLYRYTNCRLLVLDDFGKERVTGDSAQRFFRLIDSRWSNQKITVFTTNLTPQQLRQHFAQGGGADIAAAILDRLLDGRNTFLTLGGDSRRR